MKFITIAALLFATLIAINYKVAAAAAANIFGIASWYGEAFRGRKTASGEIFNPDLLTCACWNFDFGDRLLVTNTRNGKSVVVRVNDRGPAKRLNRIIDLSQAAFASIADLDSGLIRVRIEKL